MPTDPELRWADLYSRLAAHLIERGRAENALREAEQTHRARLEEEVANRTAELQVRVAERDALLQEVHHRVKNNLHVITSMLEMQGRRQTISLPSASWRKHAIGSCPSLRFTNCSINLVRFQR